MSIKIVTQCVEIKREDNLKFLFQLKRDTSWYPFLVFINLFLVSLIYITVSTSSVSTVIVQVIVS